VATIQLFLIAFCGYVEYSSQRVENELTIIFKFMPIVSAAFSTILVIISQVSSNSSAERDTRIRFSNADVAIAALSPSTHTLICLNLYCTEVAETWRGLKPYTKADMEIWFVCGLFLPLVMLLFLAAFVVPAWVPFCQMLQFRVVKKEDSEYTTVEEASV